MSDTLQRSIVWTGPILLFSCGAIGHAQMNTVELGGVVRDPVHAMVPRVPVIAVEMSTRLQFTTATDDAGQYVFGQLAPGEYSLTVKADGFKQLRLQHVILHVGEHVRQDFDLELGDVSTIVPVQVDAGILQTESGEVRDLIESSQLADLPLKDRQFLELALLSEGVVNPPGGTRGDSLQQTGKLINIFGQRTGHNLFLVDGVSVTDEYYNNVVFNPSPDEVMEFKIAKTNYSPEFGGKSGGVINVTTRSGGDELHGSVHEFFRNNAFDARNFFAPSGRAATFQESQFGGVAGGPLKKSTTFFFLNYDGQRLRESLFHLFSVPTAAERSGNFAGLAVISNPITHQPYPGNILTGAPDAAATGLLAKVPLPNLSGNANNLLGSGTQRFDTDQYNLRIDHQFSAADSAHIRGSVFDANEADPFGSSVLNEALLPGFGRILQTRTVNLMASETHTFSPTALNEFRIGWLRVSGGQEDPNAGNPFASQYGLQGATSNPKDFGYPQASLSNTFSTIGDATGFATRINRDIEAYDNVMIHRGVHSIQFGAYFFHLSFNPAYPNDARGVYTFSGGYTGSPLADFLLGIPAQAQVGIGEGAENATTNWAHFYVQDGWQISRKLRFEAGLRYEFNQNLIAANQTSSIDFSAPGGPRFVVASSILNLSPLAAATAALSPIPVVSAGSIGWNNSLLTPKSIRLSPRTAVAWSPNSDTVIRAAFGIYTNQAAYSILQNLAENVPFFLIKTVANPASPVYSTGNILAASPTGAVGANSVNHNFAIEYNEVWNATVQRQIFSATTVEAEYVGSRTVHADSSTALNIPAVAGGARPVPALSAFTTIRWDGWGSYQGLTLKATRRFARGLSFAAGWTWSHSLDDASDAGTTNAEYNLPKDPRNPNNLGTEAASSSFDHRHRLTANAVYDLPLGRNSGRWVGGIIGGWRASGILIAQKGAPFTVNLSSAAGQDVARIGLVNGNNIERPNLIGNPNDGRGNVSEWFNTSAFSLPALNTFGSAGRNVVLGPGLSTLDMSLQKDAPIGDRLHILLRFDLYNSLNHPNFDLPGRIFGASNFAVIGSAQDPREMQFAFRLSF